MVVAALGRAAGRLLRTGAAVSGRRRAGGGVHIPPRYRQYPELTRAQVIQGEALCGFMWFWILWQFWHNSDMVLVRPARRPGAGGAGRAGRTPLTDLSPRDTSRIPMRRPGRTRSSAFPRTMRNSSTPVRLPSPLPARP
uniref:NADH dehydrogenase [ubiquinone] 1 beta subcomplex subunit 2, mitochondrial n=1 Tax=Geospiza parvula TaxID=87175 RepID=A0A8U8BE69_GEOPR